MGVRENEVPKDDTLTTDERIALELYTATRKGKTVNTDEIVEQDSEDSLENTFREDRPTTDEKITESGAAPEDDEDKRGITYEMFKNKGLAPKRNKMQRNPRVKHRHKFEKAKIRRKGQVRTLRTETKKYGGEASGINMRVKKGIKLM